VRRRRLAHRAARFADGRLVRRRLVGGRVGGLGLGLRLFVGHAWSRCTPTGPTMPRSLPSPDVTDVHRPATTDEEILGAQAPVVATEHTETERLARIHDELAMGFDALAGITRGVSIFGSARIPAE